MNVMFNMRYKRMGYDMIKIMDPQKIQKFINTLPKTFAGPFMEGTTSLKCYVDEKRYVLHLSKNVEDDFILSHIRNMSGNMVFFRDCKSDRQEKMQEFINGLSKMFTGPFIQIGDGRNTIECCVDGKLYHLHVLEDEKGSFTLDHVTLGGFRVFFRDDE